MAKYRVGLVRKPSYGSSAVNVMAKTPQEAMQKAQTTNKDYIIVSATPIQFEVRMQRKPTTAEKWVPIEASNPQYAAESAMRNNSGYVVVMVSEVKNF